MSETQDILEELQDIQRELREALSRSWDWETTVVDHGHGLISLNIPADQEDRVRRRKDCEEPSDLSADASR